MARPSKKNLIIAVSGGGRSLANLLKSSQKSDCHYVIAGVISSRENIPANELAKTAGLPLFIGDFRSTKARETAIRLQAWLASRDVFLICLAGFLAPFPLLPSWQDRVINIHPALLPRHGGKGMYGHHVHEAVIDAQEKESGATIHKVTEHYDEGRILAQVRIAVTTKDPHVLAQDVFQAECHLYPALLETICQQDAPNLEAFPKMEYEWEIAPRTKP